MESEVAAALVGNVLNDIPSQPRRGLDLFRKLVQEVRTLDTQVAKWLAYAVAEQANQYDYEQFFGPGFVAIEAQKVVIAVVERVGDLEGREVLDRSIRVCFTRPVCSKPHGAG